MQKFFYLLLCFYYFFSIQSSSAQVYKGAEANVVVKGAIEIRKNVDRNYIDFIKLDPAAGIEERSHLDWLRTDVLALNSKISLELVRKETDQGGYTHYRYQEFIEGIPVEYGVYYIHVKNGLVESANGELYFDFGTIKTAELTNDEAFSFVLAVNPSAKYNDEEGGVEAMRSGGKLVLLPGLTGEGGLAYKFDLYTIEPLKRVYIYIDAFSGRVIKEVSRIHNVDANGTAVTGYNGIRSITTDSTSASNFRLRANMGFGGLQTLNLQNSTSYPSATEFTDANNYWNSTSIDKYAYDAHFGAEATYNWYKNRFGRNSFDDAGAAILTYVHYSFNYVNAFWDGTRMTYGDGDGIDFTPLTSLDIVGHEITHAITEHTAALVYSNESGALNESFSDCFGITIDYYMNPTTANFLEGEQVNVNGIPFRNSSNPNQFNNPDTYGGLFWNSPNEVHNNSGVMNYWYYLLCIGGGGTNDLGNSFTVTGLGLVDASAIAYRSLSVYLTPNSNYADARFYSIQAAIDLFGSCSNQVLQVTNAWYAVGVGGVFSNAVVAGFNAQQNFFCTLPVAVTFLNQSINASTYLWDFGDGTTSTIAAPIHTYTTAGIFSVSLIVNGIGSCSSTDTLIIPNFITITNGGGPVVANCTPATVSSCCGIGISNVNVGTINKTTAVAEGYRDFTCSNSTTLVAGDPTPITITTGINYFENVKVWIDYNNNGQFNNTNELVFSSSNKIGAHSGIIKNSITALLNTPLRMRVIDDYFMDSITSGCYNPANGQAEDYTVTFIANTLPPIAGFVATPTIINVGGAVNFTDLTIHAATSWLWTFPGGTPASSTTQNPIVAYGAIGTYPVTLKVTNSFGSDSITNTSYIHVVNSINLCGGINTTTAPNGQLYDSGGPTGSYQNGESCSLLIDPGCALSITLAFSSFLSEGGLDYIRVYNGTSTAAPLLLTASGSTLPSAVTASSGKMFISWQTDGSVTYQGFAASWSSIVGTGNPPVASFTISSTNPPLATPVTFTDQTSNIPFSWYWDFGDGQISLVKNPVHSYAASGTYMVTLIAVNCISSDTATSTIVVQAPPVIEVNPDSIEVTLNCGDSITVPLTIYNTGNGDLIYHIDSNSSLDTVRVLVFMTGVDQFEEYPRTLQAISTYFTKYKITQFFSTNPVALQTALQNQDVLLFPEHETNISGNYPALATVVQNFVTSGNNVILCSSYGSTPTLLREIQLGLFAGNLSGNATGSLAVLDTTDELTEQIPLNFIASNATSYVNFTNTDKVELVSYNSNDVVAYRNIGAGKAIYIGFDYYGTTPSASRIIANAVELSSHNGIGWLNTTASADTLHPGDSTVIYVTINSAGLNAGNYYSQLMLHINDLLNPIFNVPVHLLINGQAEMHLSDTCKNFGTIMQYTSAMDTLTISNSGCDTLHISSITSTNPVFSAIPVSLNVAPFEAQKIIITFHPLTINQFSGQLNIVTSIGNAHICLNGISGAAPLISFNPSTINVSVNACDDSVTVPVYVINSGGSDLHYDLVGQGVNTTKHVLAMTHGVDLNLGAEFENTIDAINQFYTNYTLYTTNTTSPSVLQTLLVNKDVLLLPEQESGIVTFYPAMASVVQNFVSNGGTIIVCGGDAQYSNRLYTLGLFTGAYAALINGLSINVLASSDNLMDSVSNPFIGSNATFAQLFTNIDKVHLANYNTYDVVTYRNIGTGRAIYLAFDYFDKNIATQRIISNCIKYAGAYGLPEWLQLTTATGTVVPGDSELIYVTLHSGQLSGGMYHANIIVSSNDPLHLIDTLQVNMNVGSNPCTDFNFNIQSICSGQVTFSDTTVNPGTSWNWDFGDGTFSSLQNPLHVYAAPGNYSVSFVACNASGCDTVIKSVNIISVNGPINASCSPVATGYCCGVGITNVHFNTINKTSINASEGYKDFSCTNSTTVIAGDPTPITITTGTGNYENVKVWIDYNNNGQFNNTTELVFTSDNKLNMHNGVINNSITAILNTPLRMRVMDDYYLGPISNACTNPIRGQAEDYTVTFIANTLPPVVDFVGAPTTINTGGTVSFADLTIHAATSWLWTFPGGTPASSTTQYPIVTYGTIGIYPVTLKVSNSFGSDSITKTAYIHVVNSINLCGGITTTTAPNGQLYDSGGPTGSYLNGENCSLLIDPGCALSITLSFASFLSEGGADYLRVYNGTSTAAPLLLNVSGSTLPASVTASTGKMFLYWHTDGSITYPGFAATWTSVVGTGNPPVASFAMSSANPPIATPVAFTDQTNNVPLVWYWDFGDGQGSTVKNPLHSYADSGTYTVTLIAGNCISSDTTTRTLVVQEHPIINVIPDSIDVTLNCSDSISVALTVFNSGNGDLVYQIEGSGLTDTVRVLAFMTGVDIADEYPKTLQAISTYFTKYRVTQFTSTNPVALQAALQNQDVLLFPEHETTVSGNYPALATVVQNFIASGNNVILCAGTSAFSTLREVELGLFSGSFVGGTTSSTLTVSDTTDNLMELIPLTFMAPNATNYVNFTNTDKVELVSYNNNDVVTYRNIGAGKVIYIGFDYYATNPSVSRIIANAVKLKANNFPGWLTVSSSSDTLGVGDSIATYVNINGSGLSSGIYHYSIIISSNDSLNPTMVVPVTLHMSAFPCANFTYIIPNTCNGNVNFTNTALNTPTSWLWDFGDGQTSLLPNPSHQYLTAGPFVVTLITANAIGSDTITHSVNPTMFTAAFTVSGIQKVGAPLTFIPTTTVATHYWQFGDGFTSTLTSPIHTYNTVGTFQAKHTASNSSCNILVQNPLVILPIGIEELALIFSVAVNPNPFTDKVTVSYTLNKDLKVSMNLFDAVGKLAETMVNGDLQSSGYHEYVFGDVAPGIYFIKLNIGEYSGLYKVVKIK